MILIRGQLILIVSAVILISSVTMAPLDESSTGLNELKKRDTHSGTSSLTSNSTRSEPTPTEMPTEFTSLKNTSTFSCHGRITGYYADVKLECKVYHFCTQMETFGETYFQRMSYICLQGSVFDQRDLNCVKESELKVPCNQAEAEFESSNKQFDSREDNQPSLSDSLAANIMMNPFTRFLVG